MAAALSKQHTLLFHVLLRFGLILFLMMSKAQAVRKQLEKRNVSVSGILVFGDSTVDPGNNNYVQTIFKGNFPPYGRDFVNRMPTGRFTNGRLSTDFIASYLGLKEYVPPYLDPSLGIEDLMTGVSFASAGSGFDPLTPKISNVIPISRQLEYFKEYKKRLELSIGKQRTETHIKKAVYIVSAGTNDFVINYFALPIRRKYFTISEYQLFVIQHVKKFLQDLWAEGARKIAVVGLSPMGCLPIVITINSNNPFFRRGCIDFYSSIARSYNQILQTELHFIQLDVVAPYSVKIYYIDSYRPLTDMIERLDKYGFDEVDSGCCGTGLLEASFLCNTKSYVCPDASKYIFWDSIHPTEKAYYHLFRTALPILDLIIKE